jgi:predicted ATPase
VQAVAAICRRLDALPLALELAAPWMKTLTADDLLAQLEHGVLLSTAGARDLPERQRTMNATVAWSYQLLDGQERRTFRRFGGVPCRFSIEAAAAVLGGSRGPPFRADEALIATAGLIDKSLLHRADSAQASRPLYQMLETVQDYAASELDAFGERDEALEGLARYCVEEASRAEHELVGPSQIEWLDRVRDDLDNYKSSSGRRQRAPSNTADDAGSPARRCATFNSSYRRCSPPSTE